MRAPILIAGPTASGKSALAMELARAVGGVVVNADSQQVYREWRVLTARPSAGDEAKVPHRLYGHVGVGEAYSVGRWLGEVGGVLAEGQEGRPSAPARAARFEGGPGAHPTGARGDGGAGLRPIVVGGTGLYFAALTEGLAPIPKVPAEVRRAGEAALERVGLAAFAAEFARRDPGTAAGVDLANPRRVLRAWEVLEATGTGLAEWQSRTPAPLAPLEQAVAVWLEPPRDRLYARCEARFDAMLAEGALDEVRRVMALGLPRTAPAMKAVGAAELAAHLAGETTLDAAVVRAKAATRRYAKRQLSWMRNRMAGWTVLHGPDMESNAGAVLAMLAGR